MTQQYSQLTNHKVTGSANQSWKPKHATRTKRGKHFNRLILKVNNYQYFSCELQSKANLKAVSFLRKTNWTAKIFDLIYLTNKVLCISQLQCKFSWFYIKRNKLLLINYDDGRRFKKVLNSVKVYTLLPLLSFNKFFPSLIKPEEIQRKSSKELLKIRTL